MKKMVSLGTGENSTTTCKNLRLKLLNTPISEHEAVEFVKKVTVDPVRVIFSNRKTKRRFGTAFICQRRIILYRHAVGTFLHELAHVIARNNGHKLDFGRINDWLIWEWKKWKEQ